MAFCDVQATSLITKVAPALPKRDVKSCGPAASCLHCHSCLSTISVAPGYAYTDFTFSCFYVKFDKAAPYHRFSFPSSRKQRQ